MSMWFKQKKRTLKKQKSKDSDSAVLMPWSLCHIPKLAYNTGNLVETIWRDHEFFRTERASFVVAEIIASEAFGK